MSQSVMRSSSPGFRYWEMIERSVHMVSESKSNIAHCKLGLNDPTSHNTAVHYSFDYAQQLH